MNPVTVFRRRNELITPFNNWIENALTEFCSSDFKPFDFNAAKAKAYPKVNIYKEGPDAVIRASVPFFKRENISVTLEENVLVLSGNSVNKEEDEETYCFKQEISFSGFTRTFPIDKNLYHAWIKRVGEDLTKFITADLEEGVLTVRLLGIFVVEEERPKVQTIEVKSPNKDAPHLNPNSYVFTSIYNGAESSSNPTDGVVVLNKPTD